ncbi:proteasome subunit beta [Candidatus Micrarchaeota archaeon]|nr:proteasome subunit beta [Candidatus Micrarchaeota archaeon]MBU1930776.1 proteasome subunit beta [Candidatus Micrarchaeota archaeon]
MISDLKTGTTTIGLIARDSVVLAADMRASLGHIAYDEENDKLSEITPHTGLTNAGSVGDTMTIVRYLRNHAKMYALERETEITTKGLVTFLSNILSGNRYYPFEVQFVIGGVVPQSSLFEVTPLGAMLERKKYAVSGSGTEMALSTLDLNYKTDMEENDAIELAVRAIGQGKRRDIFSGGKSISVMVIDSKGIRRVPQKIIEKYIKNHNTN